MQTDYQMDLLGKRGIISELPKSLTKKWRLKTENRVFMFLDLVGSTTVAEQLGHKQYHLFLDAFFTMIAAPISYSSGEVYKYMGDELILTWPISDKFQTLDCLRLIEDINFCIERFCSYFLLSFGICPQFRAALHCGPVAVGELGSLNREHAYSGDTINTTARILEVGARWDYDLLVSADFLHHHPTSSPFIPTYLGSFKLRGKQRPISLSSIKKANT